jgi:hypothetical protein
LPFDGAGPTFRSCACFGPLFLFAIPLSAFAQSVPDPAWLVEFPETNFKKSSITFDEIVTDGPKRDQIPPIHNPKYINALDDKDLGPQEPVLSIVIKGDARAYPLRILLWHEIVNEVIGGVPVLISYCPLCNSGVVFDRRIDGRTLSFGNTGRIRHFDMVMYDQQTGSWWQQFTGEAIIGDLTRQKMKLVPARLESLARFKARAPKGKLLVPENVNARPYGMSPYQNMERAEPRVFSSYPLPARLKPMDRVIVIGNEAWPLKLLKNKKEIEVNVTRVTLKMIWIAGQNSLHDTQKIANGRDVGNVIVTQDGKDFPYDVTFAFAFKAFRPDGIIHLD